MPRKMKMNMDDAKMHEYWAMHKKMMGCKMLVLGALVLANSYWNVVSWTNFIGIVLAVAGIAKLVGCGKCK
jgi:uncharacterized membrane protein HdeD (DUF308 family)